LRIRHRICIASSLSAAGGGRSTIRSVEALFLVASSIDMGKGSSSRGFFVAGTSAAITSLFLPSCTFIAFFQLGVSVGCPVTGTLIRLVDAGMQCLTRDQYDSCSPNYISQLCVFWHPLHNHTADRAFDHPVLDNRAFDQVQASYWGRGRGRAVCWAYRDKSVGRTACFGHTGIHLTLIHAWSGHLQRRHVLAQIWPGCGPVGRRCCDVCMGI
jgi:hypothetical protein